MADHVAMDIEEFFASLSEEERKELTDSINQELEELHEQQRLALQTANYWFILYCVFAFIFCGILVYFGRKLYLWRIGKLRRKKLQRKIERKKAS
ncbi:hypothetical protein Trydic_g4408 [Trypoxylus dichotomus]